MKVILANPRGFCAGVNMAIEVVNEVLRRKGPPVYVFHEIVHNKHVVDDFRARGVTFVNSIDEVPEGELVVYSAHGVSPEVRSSSRTRRLYEVDATCPLVHKVHAQVIRYARDGYTIIFIGHRNHDEAVGTVGEAPDRIVVVEDAEEAEKLDFPPGTKLAFTTQTTLSLSDANRVIEVLKRKFPDIRFPQKEDICYATTNRQNAVSTWAPEVDVVLVIGSKNSSNSQRLVDRAIEAGKRGYLIDDASELNPEWLTGVKVVLVTAGASAPDHLVQQLLERLKVEFGAQIETRELVREDIDFELPKSVRQLPVLHV
ncbi:MAG: 4-hydroxy-3-methylbut-2-enyl diphosphate reductase [Phycisphaerae bacterium]|jgi:4-hydroxy-3-methylbut-2-enyl diphosphate reductase|nr:MAG: 4-hydroxy-3-methylbut-2-enyl diphosphate reductase [Phycisphaerae bacterium]